jgi:hypothetical protein
MTVLTRHFGSARLALALLLFAPPLPAAGQERSDTVAAFLDAVRAATGKYRDRSVAIAAGYRKVGPDFPGMGEHWVQPGRLASGRFDPAEPPILTYVLIDGAPVLTGAAFAQPLGPHEAVPEFPSRDAWHDHTGSVDEESLLIAPAGHAAAHVRSSPGPRLAMLHAWVWTENPDGVFAQDNWALPYARLGLTPPAAPSVAAARALSFAAGGDSYFLALVDAAAAPSPEEREPVERAVRALAHDVSALITSAGAGTSVQQRLESLWHELWREIESSVSATSWARLQAFAPGHR